MNDETATVLEAVAQERVAQDKKWGGPAHDDQHQTTDFINFIASKLAKASEAATAGDVDEQRDRLIQVSALAVAAIERLYRITTEG